jgi:hypothetical protein
MGERSDALLGPEDITALGVFSRPPTPWEQPPGSCVFQVGDGSPAGLLVLVVCTEPYEKVKALKPGAAEQPDTLIPAN